MGLERLRPDTAPKNRSIWNSVDRATFERQTRAIGEKNHIAGPRSYGQQSNVNDNADGYPLSIKVEESLADDFAFIAACEPQVDFVSAVAIEQDMNRRSLVIKLAANEGVAEHVKKKFDEIFAVLKEHAHRGIHPILDFDESRLTPADITRESCQDKLFQLIVQLNRNRILGRLQSAKFKPPGHLVKVRGPLTTRLRQLFRDNIKSTMRSPDSRALDQLDRQIRDFEAAYERLEGEDAADDFLLLGNVIKTAYILTEDGVRLPGRLRALGYPEHVLDARDVREVGKVSNYWRISRHLSICSSQFRSSFTDAQWCALPPYYASSTSPILARQFVHAEIQLLVHYELHPPQLPPRAIGVSKEACFLCDSFIRAHGRFSIAGAHRQMFAQWTVPDLEEYSLPTIKCFRQILSRVFVEVKQEYLRSQRKQPWRPFPLQSAINLNVIHLSTPSISSVGIQSRRISSSRAQTVKSGRSSAELIINPAKWQGSTESRGNGERHVGTPTLGTPIAELQNAAENLQEVPLNVDVGQTSPDALEWIRISAWFSSLPIDKTLVLPQRSWKGGTVFLEPVGDRDDERKVHVVDIPTDHDLILERDTDDVLGEVTFILIGGHGQRVRLRCRWHTS